MFRDNLKFGCRTLLVAAVGTVLLWTFFGCLIYVVVYIVKAAWVGQ